MNTVGQLASGIWEDLGSPETPSVIYVSGWIGSTRSLGKLNMLLDTCFVVDTAGMHSGESYAFGAGQTGYYDAGDYFPALGNTEQAIVSEIYKADFYDKKIRDTLNGIFEGSGAQVDWSELREGDTTIRRSNRNEVAKVYRGLLNDSRGELNRLVAFYKENLSKPRQVAGDDA